jgi:hypothetical protein
MEAPARTPDQPARRTRHTHRMVKKQLELARQTARGTRITLLLSAVILVVLGSCARKAAAWLKAQSCISKQEGDKIAITLPGIRMKAKGRSHAH